MGGDRALMPRLYRFPLRRTMLACWTPQPGHPFIYLSIDAYVYHLFPADEPAQPLLDQRVDARRRQLAYACARELCVCRACAVRVPCVCRACAVCSARLSARMGRRECGGRRGLRAPRGQHPHSAWWDRKRTASAQPCATARSSHQSSRRERAPAYIHAVLRRA